MKPTDSLVVDTICRTAEIGLVITGTADASTIAIIDTAPVTVSNTCPGCRHPGKLRGHVFHRLADLPVIGFSSRLGVRVLRSLCTAMSCPRKTFQTSLARAGDESKLTHRVTCWTLQRPAIDRMSVSATAKALGIDWDLTNQVAPDARRQPVYDNPHHLDGARILGVDKHVWKHTREPGQLPSPMTILVDLTPLVNGRGSARLLDLRSERNTEALRTWLQEHDPNSRGQVRVMTMDGLTGYAFAVGQVPPGATEVVDPLYVVHLAADKSTGCQQRLQQEIIRRHGCKDDPLYKYHRTLLTRTNHLVQRQRQQLSLLWAIDDGYVTFEVTQLFYQGMTAAYGHSKKSEGEKFVSRVTNSPRKRLPVGLEEPA